ncbi:MAG: SUMF1/EgtB/PvdO family nonheme iron enzyme [Gammaproteobacteria bacterium]|nr:SUMF1/EgtB/PvdO family nonheme iron enzyme [Gammaproteobacteria bacterium]MCP5089623.1 SUMF1/EgtB/PvdO family nonheme iron enzyme [Gammaproteobacteria bacterium]
MPRHSRLASTVPVPSPLTPMLRPGAGNSCTAGRLRNLWRTCSVCSGWRSKTGADRVIRGGSWNNNARNCRCAYRNRNQPDNRNNNLGFRCARAHDGVG